MKKILLLLVAWLAVFGANAQDPADVKVLLDSDFTVFTDGSEASPKNLYTFNINDLTPGYYLTSNVAAAGGKLLIKENGYLQLNSFSDLPSSGGTIRVTAEVYMKDYNGGLQYQPGYTSADYVTEAVKTGEWVKVVSYVGNVNSTSKLRMIPYLSVSGFYIKSLKVEYSANFIAAPEAYLPSDFDGTQFTAACSTNSSAEKYEADVFTYDADGKEVYVAQNVELKKLTATSSSATGKVTDLNPNETYYYVARCVNANGGKSANSEVVKVIRKLTSIAAPKALAATNVKPEGRFRANWEPVENAQSYIVNTYMKRTLKEEESTSVFFEDFSGVTAGSESSVEFSGDLNDYTKVPGWTTQYSTQGFASGYFVIASYGSEGYVITPAIDLSKDGGKFQFKIIAATRDYASFKASKDELKIELLDNAGNVVETAPSQVLDKAGLSEYTFDFTKGAKDSKIRITYVPEAGTSMKLFIDMIDIFQTLPAGSVIDLQIGSFSGITKNFAEIVASGEALTSELGYTVIAVGETVVGTLSSAAIGTIQSAESNRIIVDFASSGVEDIESSVAATPKAWKESAGVVKVTGCNVVVADISGKVLLKNVSANKQTYTVNHNGIVVVFVDGKSYKFAL